jgi:hypothetical protein
MTTKVHAPNPKFHNISTGIFLEVGRNSYADSFHFEVPCERFINSAFASPSSGEDLIDHINFICMRD